MSDYLLLLKIMTIKSDNILNVALKLFANQGYVNTSTSKIAKTAGVSEGLIFRHFGNKEGLLDAIISIGTSSFDQYMEQMQAETNPKKVITQIIEFPLNIIKENPDYWQLTSSLKFQTPQIASKYHNPEMINKVEYILEKAFTELNHPNPKMETKFLFISIMGLGNIIKQFHNEKEINELINYIKSKYNI